MHARGAPLLVAGTLLAGTLLAAQWSFRDRGLGVADEYRYVRAAERVQAAWRAAATPLRAASALLEVHPTHPPLVPLLLAPWLHAVGYEFPWLRLLMLPFYALLVTGVYRAGVWLGGSRQGLAAALLVAGMPLVFRYTHRIMLELPAAALATWAVADLWRARTLWGGVRAGLWAGAALLTKWTAATVLGPLLVLALWRRPRGPALLAAASAALLAAPWYGRHAADLWAFYRWNEAYAFWHLGSGRTEALLFYVRRFPWLAGLLPTLLLLASALLPGRRHGDLLCWFGFPLVVFSLIATKAYDGRHLLPALPGAALLAAGLVHRGGPVARGVTLLALLALPLQLLPPAGIPLPDPLQALVPGSPYTLVGPPDPPRPHDDGAEAVYRVLRARALPPPVAVLAAWGSLSADGLAFLAARAGDRLPCTSLPPHEAPWRLFLAARTFVVKEAVAVDANVNGFRTPLVAYADLLLREARAVVDNLEVAGAIPLPDGDRALVWVRRRPWSAAARREVWAVAARLLWGGEEPPPTSTLCATLLRQAQGAPLLRGDREALAALARRGGPLAGLAWRRLGVLARLAGQPEAAARAFAKEAALLWREPRAEERLARALAALGRSEAARQAAERARLRARAEQAPRDDWRAQARLGLLLVTLRPHEAAWRLRAALCAAPLQAPLAAQAFAAWSQLPGTQGEVRGWLARRLAHAEAPEERALLRRARRFLEGSR